jgi:hypothetical protein
VQEAPEAHYLLVGDADWIRGFREQYGTVAKPMNIAALTAANIIEADRHLRANTCVVAVFQAGDKVIELINPYVPLLFTPGSNLDAIIVDDTGAMYYGFGDIEPNPRVRLLTSRSQVFATMNSSLADASTPG